MKASEATRERMRAAWDLRRRGPKASFLARVEQPSGASGCWAWVGYRDADGYGRLGTKVAHRVAYELFVGSITADLEVDHTCFNPSCVNPAHLRLLPRRLNARLQRSAFRVSCVNGHTFTKANTYRRPNGGRDCRTCIRDRVARYHARRAA